MALGNAYMSRDTQEQADTRAKAERARSELQAAETEVRRAMAVLLSQDTCRSEVQAAGSD